MAIVISWVNKSHVKIEGVIDDRANLDELTTQIKSGDTLDLSEVSRINSFGVRTLSKCLTTIPVPFNLVNISSIVLDQLTLMPEIFKSNCTIKSFYCHFYCEQCNSHELHLLSAKDELERLLKEKDTPPSLACPKCGAALEFGHDIDTYLFLLGKIKAKG